MTFSSCLLLCAVIGVFFYTKIRFCLSKEITHMIFQLFTDGASLLNKIRRCEITNTLRDGPLYKIACSTCLEPLLIRVRFCLNSRLYLWTGDGYLRFTQNEILRPILMVKNEEPTTRCGRSNIGFDESFYLRNIFYQNAFENIKNLYYNNLLIVLEI